LWATSLALAPARPAGHTAGVDVIAEYRLHLKYLDGGLVPVRLRIGRPRRLSTGLWQCETEADGLRPAFGVVPKPGSTSWQALVWGLRFLYRMLRSEVSDGAVLYDDTGKYPIHLDELFPFPREGETPPPG
jgi:hypothetical protein